MAAKTLVSIKNAGLPIKTQATITRIDADAVTVLTYVKAYYAKVIVVLGTILTTVNTVQPLFTFLPVQYQNYVTLGLGFGTAAFAWLKKEQGLVDQL